MCTTIREKRLLHTDRIQILDIENTLHYIQKKHSIAQLKEAFSQIYNALDEMGPLSRLLRTSVNKKNRQLLRNNLHHPP